MMVFWLMYQDAPGQVFCDDRKARPFLSSGFSWLEFPLGLVLSLWLQAAGSYHPTVSHHPAKRLLFPNTYTQVQGQLSTDTLGQPWTSVHGNQPIHGPITVPYG